MHRQGVSLCLLCACIGLVASQPLTVLTVTASSLYIQDVASYSFKIVIQGDGISTLTIPAGSNIIINFPSQYPSAPPISNNCSIVTWPIAYSSISCTLNYNVLTITNAFLADYTITETASDTLFLVVQSITNPTYAQQINNPPISGLFSYNFVSLLTFSPNTYITIQSGSLGVGISASPTTTDSSSTLTISIAPTHAIPVGGCMKITLDKTYTNAAFTTSLMSQAPLCQSVTNASSNIYCSYTTNINNIIVTVTNIFATSSSSPFVFTLSPFNNPPTTQPYGSFTFATFSSSTNGLSIDISTNNRISGITPSLVTNPIAYPSATLIGSSIEMSIAMTISNAIMATDIISITTPSEIGCSVVTAVSIAGNPANTITVINSTTFQFKNIALYNPYPINITINNLTLPNYAATISSPWIMTVSRSNYLVCMMNTSFLIKLSAGSLGGGLTPSILQAGMTSNYTFALNLTHSVDSSSKITFYFSPTYFSLASTMGCISSGSTNCTAVSSGNLVTVTYFTMVTTSTISITLISVTNPSTVGTFTAIIISTYIQVSGSFYLLDSDNTFAFFSVSARPMGFFNLNVTSSTYKVYDLSTYTFTIQNNNYLPVNSYIWIIFPTQITFSTVTCNSICITGTYNGSKGIQFQQLGPISAATVSTLIVNNVINPISTKPTTSFSTYLFDSQNNLLQYLSSGITFQAQTPSLLTTSLSSSILQNSFVGWFNITYSTQYSISDAVSLILTVPNSLTCPSCSSSSVNSTYNQMVFANQTMSNGKFSLNLPNFTYFYSFEPISIQAAIASIDLHYQYASGSFSLTNQISSFPTFTYVFTNYQLQSSTDLIISNFTSATVSQRVASIQLIIGSDFGISSINCVNLGYNCITNDSTIMLSVVNFGNLTTFSLRSLITPSNSPSTYISLSTYSSSGYLIDQSSIIFWKAACTLPCKTCTSTTTECLSCYSDIVLSQSRVLYFAANMTCVADCGDQYYRNYSTNICLSCSTSCFNCYNYSYCTSCPTGQYLLAANTTCFYACPTGYFQKSINCIACTPSLNCYTCANELTCSSCYGKYFYQSQCLPSCPSPITIPNSVNYTCDSCPVNCSSCQQVNLTVVCLSCSSGLLDNGSCVQSCITYGYVPNNLVCSPCDTSCKTCQGSTTFCLSCPNSSATPYYLSNQCYSNCPNKYYNDDSNYLCMPCVSPCETCYNYSSTACISCISSFSLFGTICKSICPTTFYANGTVCSSCVSPCLTCSALAICFTCQTNFTLFSANYSCLSSCPDGYVSINQTCMSCSSNCYTCLSISFCSSCFNNSYLLNGYCYNPCPTAYYADSLTLLCQNCPTSCTACSSATFCSGCVSGYYLSNNSCISLCASNQISISNVCKACNSNCSSCQGNVNNCTSCVSGYIFAPTINSCLLQCPASLFYNPTTNTCIASCASATYVTKNVTSNVSTCNSCPSLCNSCISSSQCGGCTNGTYSYGGLCYASCPNVAPYAFNYACQSCNIVSCQSCNGTLCDMCSSGFLLIDYSLCITSCSSLQVYNAVNKTCDTIISNSSSNGNSSSSVTISGLNNVNLNFIPMPFLIVFVISAMIIGVLHIKAKLSALPAMLGVAGPLITVDVASILIICLAGSMIQNVSASIGVYTLLAFMVIALSISCICLRMRWRITQCQQPAIIALSVLSHVSLVLFTANINYYNSYFIEAHKSFWRRYKLICKVGLLLFLLLFIGGVALAFSITDRSNYIFYAGIEICILAFLQLLLTLMWIWLPVQPPPQKNNISSSQSEQSTEQVSDGHSSAAVEESGERNEKGDSMDKLNSSTKKEQLGEMSVKVRNSEIKSQGDQLEQFNSSAVHVKSNYEFNHITGVVKVDNNDIERALEKGLFRKNQEQILKSIKENEQFSKIDDAQKLNNYLKQQGKQPQLINIFQDYEQNEEDFFPNQQSPKLQPVFPPQQKDATLQKIVKQGSDGSLAACDEPLLVKQEDFHHNIIFEEDQQDNKTYFEGDTEFNQDRPSQKPFQLEPTPSLGSLIIKNTTKIKLQPNQESRLVPPEFESKLKEGFVVQDFDQSIPQNTYKVFNPGNSRIKPKHSKQLSKAQPSKEIIHADFQEIITVSDQGSLEYIQDDYIQHDSSRRISNPKINENIHDNDNGFFRPSEILRQASVHYQPGVERNQPPINPLEKPLVPRFASQLNKKR